MMFGTFSSWHYVKYKCKKRGITAVMKMEIIIDENITEDQVIIKCKSLNDEIRHIQKTLGEVINSSQKLVVYSENTEYYIVLNEILFFETDGSIINAHTKNEIYQTKYKLYELEDLLPGIFMRISKSAIVNTEHIYSINRSLTSSSVISFADTHKQVYVSRYYYKALINKLSEKRLDV